MIWVENVRYFRPSVTYSMKGLSPAAIVSFCKDNSGELRVK